MDAASPACLFDLATPDVHASAVRTSSDPLRVRTPARCWAYALTFGPHATGEVPSADVDTSVEVDLEVLRGAIGVGVVNRRGNAFIEEKFVSGGRARVMLTVPRGTPPGRLVFRNADPAGAESEFVMMAVRTGPLEPPPYLARIPERDFAAETRPAAGGAVVFDDQPAQEINRARIEWLQALALPLQGKRVLDVGAGLGHFIPFYRQHGCRVVALEGREENLQLLRERFPDVEAMCADIQQVPPASLGRFEIAHCFGLLYHLDSPVAALRRLHDACDEVLLLETMVCDSSRAVVLLADENKTVNQALQGLGCRPSPSFVALALNRVGFKHVYGTSAPPRHPDFEFTWHDDLSTSREGHNLRCVFVASRLPIERPQLVSLLENRQ